MCREFYFDKESLIQLLCYKLFSKFLRVPGSLPFNTEPNPKHMIWFNLRTLISNKRLNMLSEILTKILFYLLFK
jgi:hypothetical protein